MLSESQYFFLLVRHHQEEQQKLSPEPVLLKMVELALDGLLRVPARDQKLHERKEAVAGEDGEYYGRDCFSVHFCPPYFSLIIAMTGRLRV